VNNAVYLNYLEFARHEYLRDIGFPLEELSAEGFSMLVAEISIRYRKPAGPDDELTILTSPIKRTKISGVLVQKIFHGDDEIADAAVKWVCVDSLGKPAPLPEKYHREGLDP
jgi:acyl-CoA thioester hydrolase